MASSYQTLARYADERLGNRMLDIRQQMRRDLLSSRSRTRRAQLLQNRKLSRQPTECDDEDSHYDDGEGYDETDFYPAASDPSDVHLSSWGNIACWSSTPEPSPSNTPSPCLSDSSNWSSNTPINMTNQCDSSKNLKSNLSKSRSTLSRKEILQMRKRVQKSQYNPETVSLDYYTLKRHLIEQSHDPKAVGFILCSRWNVLAEAINALDEDLSRDAIGLMTQLVCHRLVEISDILFILQQGFILIIKNSISRLGSQQKDVLAFITCLIYIEPRATSYLIELMADTDIIKVLEDFIEFGTGSEAATAIKFYHSLIDVETSLHRNGNYIPIVPATLSRTISQSELAKIYCPLAALKRIIRPNLIAGLLSRFYRPNGLIDEPDSFNIATVMLVVSMNLSHRYIKSDVRDIDWAISVLQEFELYRFDQILCKIVQNQDGHCLNDKGLELLGTIHDIYNEVIATFRKLVLSD